MKTSRLTRKPWPPVALPFKRQRKLRGYSYRDPDGKLDTRVCDTVGIAQINAAFACERPYSHISTPSDWHRAYRQGFRIVPVTMSAGATRAPYRRYHPSDT